MTDKSKTILVRVSYALTLLFACLLVSWLIFLIGYLIWTGATLPTHIGGIGEDRVIWEPIFNKDTWPIILFIYLVTPTLGLLFVINLSRALSARLAGRRG